MKQKVDRVHPHREAGSGGRERDGLCRRQRRAEPGPHVRHPEAAERAQGQRRPGDQPPASQDSRTFPARPCIFQAAQDLQIGGRFANAQYQYTLSGEDLDELYAWAPKLTEQAAHDSAAEGRQQRPAGQRPGAERHHRSRYRRAPGNHPAADRQRALRRLRTAADFDHLPDAEPVSRRAGGRSRNIRQTPDALKSVYVITSDRRSGAAVGVRALRQPSQHFAGGHPPGTVSGGDHLVQPGARAAPGRRPPALIEQTRAADMRMPATIHGSFQGTAAAFQDSLSSRAAADSGRTARGLHRARHAVRELHPSHHDSLDAALGRHRRAAGADAVPHGAECDRADRHPAADRHREEERHHDDRLRAGSGAPGQDAAGRHLTKRRCCASVPS